MKSEAHKKDSYGQILKSSSIIGGAQGINYLIGMVRTKLVAVLLGPAGVGLVGLYMSITELVGTLAGLGINTSGVREVAEAHGSGKPEDIAWTIKTLRRACWITGILGWILCIALSYPLSLYTFNSGEHVWAIAILGSTILVGAISGGQSAIIQGTRRIGDLARVNILGAITGAMAAVGLYDWLGQNGIVPVLIVTAAFNLGFSWWFARKIPVLPVTLTWRDSMKKARKLVHIGMAFMYGAILFSAVTLTIRSLIIKNIGLDANGIYQAAWVISGMFGNFIIAAMGTDFYPRLTAVANDNAHINRLVNEQMEIGMFLALPGLLGTLVFAPWLMRLLYTAKFLPGADLLPWFVMSVFFQILIFPMGFIARAKGAVNCIYFGQTWANFVYLILAYIMLSHFGIAGVAFAGCLNVAIYSLLVYGIANHLTSFKIAKATSTIFFVSCLLIVSTLIIRSIHYLPINLCLGSIVTIVGCVISFRGIASRLGHDHRIIVIACSLPGGAVLCGRNQ